MAAKWWKINSSMAWPVDLKHNRHNKDKKQNKTGHERTASNFARAEFIESNMKDHFHLISFSSHQLILAPSILVSLFRFFVWLSASYSWFVPFNQRNFSFRVLFSAPVAGIPFRLFIYASCDVPIRLFWHAEWIRSVNRVIVDCCLSCAFLTFHTNDSWMKS